MGKQYRESQNCAGDRVFIEEDTSCVCWVATACYGDPFHADVVTLRSLRDFLIKNSLWGRSVDLLNRAYVSIGNSPFGKWWADGTRPENDCATIRRTVSKLILGVLLAATPNRFKE